jgi:excisionase family DNA binding protein
MLDELMTVDEVAEHLKVNQQTVRNWIDSGDLLAVRVGARRVRVRQRDLEEFLNLRTMRGPSADPTTDTEREAEPGESAPANQQALLARDEAVAEALRDVALATTRLAELLSA